MSLNEIDKILNDYSMSKRKLAKLLNVSPSAITHWYNSRCGLSKYNSESLHILIEELSELTKNRGMSNKEAISALLVKKSKEGVKRIGIFDISETSKFVFYMEGFLEGKVSLNEKDISLIKEKIKEIKKAS